MVSKQTEMERELPGVIGGAILFIILVGISWFLGEVGIFSLGWGGIELGIVSAGFFGYLYAALNRKRRFDSVMFLMIFGYLLGAYVIELFFPVGQIIVNIATSSAGTAVIVYFFNAIYLIVLIFVPFVYAKRTDLG